MAVETLESRLIIQDEASRALEEIERQAESAEEALQAVQRTMEGVEAAGDISRTATESTRGVQREIEGDSDLIDLSVLEEINRQNEEAWAGLLSEVEASADDILQEWEDAENGIASLPDEAETEAERQGEHLREGVRGLGADIAGWWSIIKDAFGQIRDAFEKLAEESDKLNTRLARFGLVADSEGRTDRDERSRELYKEHQKYSQALGVTSEAFNETVLNMYSNGQGIVKSIEEAQAIAASSYMAMDIAGLRGRDKDAVMGEVQSMVAVGIADPDQIQESMKIAPNILRTIEKQWEKNMNGKALKLDSGEEITDATGKIAVLAQQGQITADLVAQAMVNSAQETNETWQKLPSTWEKLQNRVQTIVENMTFEIMEAFGKLADDPQIAHLAMEAMRTAEKAVNFATDYIVPVIGGLLAAIASTTTSVLQTINTLTDSVPGLIAIGAAAIAVAAKAGLLTKTVAILKAALLALSANPVMLILGAVAAVTLGVAHLVRTTETGQEIMLEATAAVSLAFQQVGAVFMNLLGVGKWVLSRLAAVFQSFAMGILNGVEWVLEQMAGISDTAAEALDYIRSKKSGLAENITATINWGDDGVEDLKKQWAENKDFYDQYRTQIPEIAKANLAKDKDELKLTGYLDGILNELEHSPGKPNNPAEVKGKVAIDGEYFDTIRRAAGVEIVNRYTTLRPTVNASFGDVHQMDAQDVLGQLGKEVEAAEAAAISDAQALGA